MALHSRPTRRQCAAFVAAVLGATLGGCTGDTLQNAYARPPEHTPISEECEREHQEVLDLRIRNLDDEPHVVELTVTGEPEDGPSEPIFEETYELPPDRLAARAVAFDPDRADIERYDDFVARATTADGQSDSNGIYTTVVSDPLRHGLWITIESEGRVSVGEVVSDSPADHAGGTC